MSDTDLFTCRRNHAVDMDLGLAVLWGEGNRRDCFGWVHSAYASKYSFINFTAEGPPIMALSVYEICSGGPFLCVLVLLSNSENFV